MKVLLDTHIFLWFISGNSRLPDKFEAAIRDSDNFVYLSVASIWEATIKYQLGKLPYQNRQIYTYPKQRKLHKISSLSIEEGNIVQLASLPPLHRDPFDRLLVAQALQYKLSIMTVDKTIKLYPATFFEDSL